MTTDEALTFYDATPTDLSDLSRILESGHALAAEVRLLRRILAVLAVDEEVSRKSIRSMARDMTKGKR